MRKISFSITLLLAVFYITLSFAQISPKKGVKPPAYFAEFQRMLQSEYSKGYYADKFRERKQIREQISQGLLPESTLDIDTVFALTLLGQYTNLFGFYTQQEFQAQLYDGPNPTGTVTDYYTEVSYNQLYFTGDAQGWYDVGGPLENYLGQYGGPNFVLDVIADSDPILNYADYIQYYDGQGRPRIGFLAVVHAGAGAEAGANNIWSHRWDFRVISASYTTNDIDPVSGQNVIIDGPYAIMPERSGGSNNGGSLIEIGVFAHEFGHIFGIPDLYDTDGSSEGIGEWCLMASGSWGGNGSSPETPVHMSAWVKKQLGWVTPINITSLEKALSIPNVEENPIVYRMWADGSITNQYYLVENRQKIGFDANIHDSGFLVFHVDDAQNNNQNEDHYKVDLEQADGLRSLNNGSNRGDSGDPFPGSTNNTRFDWNTNPNSKNYNLVNTFVSVRNIQKNENDMVGNFDIHPGPFLYTDNETILFELAFGEPPLVKTVTISNYGFDDLHINSITAEAGPFTLLTQPTYPVTLVTDESLNLEIEFYPTDINFYSEFMAFDDNDPAFDGLTLNGQAHIINPAFTDVLYASTGVVENSKILKVDRSNGAGTEIGLSNYEKLNSLTIDPISNVLYGISSSDSETELVKINALGGDAFTQYILDLSSMAGIAFDAAGTLYGAALSGEIYTINLSDGSYTLVTTANISMAAITINPVTNQMWAARKSVIGAKDRIYTIDLITGEGTLVGQTGFGITINDLAFDENGTFYGVIGEANENGQLIKINTTDGSGTLVGDIGFQNVIGLAYTITGDPNYAEDETSGTLPIDFALNQNYPNPFNPTTNIEFSLPVAADIQLVVYNILGQQVASLINEQRSAGNHSVLWNANDSNGMKLSSGIYLYKLKASGVDGSEFQEIKKMVLLK